MISLKLYMILTLKKRNSEVIFLGGGSPSAFNRIASAENSPFQKTRLFGKYSITG